MRLLDPLGARKDWSLIDGCEVRSVTDWVAEWNAGAETEGRGRQ